MNPNDIGDDDRQHVLTTDVEDALRKSLVALIPQLQRKHAAEENDVQHSMGLASLIVGAQFYCDRFGWDDDKHRKVRCELLDVIGKASTADGSSPMIVLGGKEWIRIPFGHESDPTAAENGTCPNCGVEPGWIHVAGCDVESCPVCGLQLLACQAMGRHEATGSGAWAGSPWAGNAFGPPSNEINPVDVRLQLDELAASLGDVPLDQLTLEQLAELQAATEELGKLIERRLGSDEKDS